MLVDVGTLGEVAETHLAAKGFYDEIGEVVLETIRRNGDVGHAQGTQLTLTFFSDL